MEKRKLYTSPVFGMEEAFSETDVVMASPLGSFNIDGYDESDFEL